MAVGDILLLLLAVSFGGFVLLPFLIELRRGRRASRGASAAPVVGAELLTALAERYGLWERGGVASGEIAGVRVELRLERGVVVTSIPQQLPSGLSLEPRLSASERIPGEVRTGDPSFDELLVVTGPPAIAQAFLDRATRSRILHLVGGGPWSIGGAGIRFAMPPGGTVADLELRDALEIAKRLAAVDAPAAGLAAIVADRLEPDLVRDACFDRYVVEAPTAPEVNLLCQVLLTEQDAALRFRAALRLEHAETMAELVATAGTFKIMLRAAEWLADKRPEALPAALETRLREGASWALIDAVAPLALRVHAPATVFYPALGSQSSEARAAAGRAIASLGLGAADEALLVRLIASDQNDPTRLAAIAQLAERGTTAAVEPLNAIESRELRDAAHDAVRRIQARAGGEKGALSVTDDDAAGRLSEPDDGGRGALSLPRAAKTGERK